MRSVVVCTYSQVPELYRFSSALVDLPYFKLRLKNWNRYYTTELLNVEADWIIHIDEDAFMLDSSRIELLLMYMEEHGYVCAGIPDGGVLDIRFHNPVACNAFFLILHRKAILPYIHDFETIRSCKWREEYRELTPEIVLSKGLRFEYCECEPFYGLYFWLCSKKFPILYLDAEEWSGESERTSCLLKDHTDMPFLLHTWYSRQYRPTAIHGKSPVQLLKRLKNKIQPFNKGLHYDRIRRAMEYVESVNKNR